MRQMTLVFMAFMMLVAAQPVLAAGPYNIHLPASLQGVDPQALTLVGAIQHYRTQKGDDLLEIARHYGLGYSELGVLYRHWDPFILPAGAEVTIPTLWIVPNNHGNQIIVNTGEMRLYYFINNNTQVYTFPIGMGVLDFQDPPGEISGNREEGEAGLAHPQVPTGQVWHGGDAAGGRKPHGRL